MRIYSLQTGEPLYLIGMKGYDNGQFLQPTSLCFLRIISGGSGASGKERDSLKEDVIEENRITILAVGDSNNKLQVCLSNTFGFTKYRI